MNFIERIGKKESMNHLTNEEIQRQSWAAYNQWRSDWIANTKHNKNYIKRSIYKELEGMGRGKNLIIVANGPSLGKHWDLIKQYRQYFHIACVDKAFKPLMEHGIVPNFVCLCDANVDYKKYCEGLDTSQTFLLSNIAGEKNWVSNWKGNVYFFINKDSIKSEQLFTSISNYAEYIPAASNVSNALIVLCFFILKYDYNLLTGYDYSWKLGEYYSDGPTSKECWMSSHILSDLKGDRVRLSQNLSFSARWISDFLVSVSAKNFINCSGQGLLPPECIPSVDFEHAIKQLTNLNMSNVPMRMAA